MKASGKQKIRCGNMTRQLLVGAGQHAAEPRSLRMAMQVQRRTHRAARARIVLCEAIAYSPTRRLNRDTPYFAPTQAQEAAPGYVCTGYAR